VARVRDFGPGERRIVEVDGVEIGVFNVQGQYYALRSRCPHQGAPLCRGRIVGTTLSSRPYETIYAREGEIIKCPWHGWEFDILTGRSVFNPHRVRVVTYDVTVEPIAPEEADPSIETYPVTVEDGLVILHA
jgi:3-phenylpropionate/trans-cinnamate dioxygenase ferredoxin subunit